MTIKRNYPGLTCPVCGKLMKCSLQSSMFESKRYWSCGVHGIFYLVNKDYSKKIE